jgi:hypothetical protein
MLSEDVEEKGFTLLCMAYPQSDVEVVTCKEVRRKNQLGLASTGRLCQGGSPVCVYAAAKAPLGCFEVARQAGSRLRKHMLLA